MSAYFTHAISRPAGFYRTLHAGSTVDVVTSSLSTQDVNDPDVYEVERLVSSRKAKVT